MDQPCVVLQRPTNVKEMSRQREASLGRGPAAGPRAPLSTSMTSGQPFLHPPTSSRCLSPRLRDGSRQPLPPQLNSHFPSCSAAARSVPQRWNAELVAIVASSRWICVPVGAGRDAEMVVDCRIGDMLLCVWRERIGGACQWRGGGDAMLVWVRGGAYGARGGEEEG
jgi:hypothetical protein